MDKIRISLGICIAIIIVMIGAGAYLFTDLQNQIPSLKDENSSLQDQITTLNEEKNNLGNQVTQLQLDKTSLQNEISRKDSQILSLSSQITGLQSPNLIKINLGEEDNRTWLATPHLRVQAVIVNLGTNIAYRCKLHVILYQGTLVAVDTDIPLGSIAGREWVTMDEQVSYSGSALTSWSVIPEWEVTPEDIG